MFGNYNQFGNYSMPTGTQTYGYPMNYNMPQQPQMQTNTNKIYVSGIEDVRQRQLPNGSDIIFLDNDKPILYQKIVDSKGQFEVKAFTITPYAPQESARNEQAVDLSAYAKQTDIATIKGEIQAIKERLGV